MNNFKNALTLFIVIFCMWSLVLGIYVKGVPYTWTLGGKTVYDENVYTGRYYQCNDHIRIMTIEDKELGKDKLYVYKKINGKWVQIDAWMYLKHANWKPVNLFFLRVQYAWSSWYSNDGKPAF